MLPVKGKPAFLDTNILLRHTVPEFPEHDIVREGVTRLAKQGAIFWISRQVLREFASTLTRPQTFGSPLKTDDVAQRVENIAKTLNVADETARVTRNWIALLKQYDIGGKQIHDANIVATMQTHKISLLVTLNIADFKRFESLIMLVSLDELLQMPNE